MACYPGQPVLEFDAGDLPSVSGESTCPEGGGPRATSVCSGGGGGSWMYGRFIPLVNPVLSGNGCTMNSGVKDCLTCVAYTYWLCSCMT